MIPTIAIGGSADMRRIPRRRTASRPIGAAGSKEFLALQVQFCRLGLKVQIYTRLAAEACLAATARLGKAWDPRPDFSPAILTTHSVSRHFRCETAPERFAIHGARATNDAPMIVIAKSGRRTAPRYGNLSNAMARMAKAPLMRAPRTCGRPGGWRSILQVDPGHG